MNETYRGMVRGGMVMFLEEDTSLTESTELFVTPVVGPSGLSAAILSCHDDFPFRSRRLGGPSRATHFSGSVPAIA